MMAEITKTENPEAKTVNRFIWLLLAAAAIFVYFFGLNLPLLGPDEPRYAQVAREMYERGDWVTPTLAGAGWFEKPALLYWLEIVSYKLFDVSEFSARLGSVMFGLSTSFCLWILGKKTQSPESKGNDFPIWLVLTSASSLGLIAFSHAASFDIIITFPLTASLVGFFIFDQSKEKTFSGFYLPLISFYFFIGVALIGKGLIGIVFPFAIIAFYYVLSWRLPSKDFVFSILWGTILSLLVAAIWYVPMYQANGWKFIDEFFIQHHFQRYISNKYQHPQPFWYFWFVLPLMTLPWLPFFLASVWRVVKAFILKFRRREQEDSLNAYRSPLAVFAFAWMLVPLVFFSLSGSKLAGYILPSLPAAMILAAEYIYPIVQKNLRARRTLQMLALLTFICAAIVLQFFVEDYARHESVKGLIETANAEGFSEARILNLYTISNNAEFYAAGRLPRTPDRKQIRFDGDEEIYEQLKRDNKPALVLVPLDGVKYLTVSKYLMAKVLADNGELAIVAVEKK